MWHDYFYKSTIYGIDIRKIESLDNDRIVSYVADQSSQTEIEEFVKKIGSI